MVDYSLQVGGELLPKVKEFKYLWVVYEWEEDGAGAGQADQCDISSNAGIVLHRCGEEGAGLQCKAYNSPVDFCSDPQLWSWALGTDCENEIVNTSSQKEYSL